MPQPRSPADTLLRKRVDAAIAELRASECYKAVLQQLNALQGLATIACLSVSSFSSSDTARGQLALALSLRDDLRPDVVDVTDAKVDHDDSSKPRLHIIDSVLSELELRCIRSFGGSVDASAKTEEESGRVSLPGRCLCIIALDCRRQRYSNLLEANWGASRLADVLLLGAAFSSMKRDAGTSDTSDDAVARLVPIVSEIPCAGAGPFDGSSLHYFEVSRMPPPDDAVWTRPFERADANVVLGTEDDAPPSAPGWLEDDSSQSAQWVLVKFPNVGLGNRLQALSSAALLAQDTGRRLAVVWRRGDSACGAAMEDLFAPSALLLPRAPSIYAREARDDAAITVGALDALGAYAQQRRAHVACWELKERSDWYVSQMENEAKKAEARRRQTEWLSKLRPAAGKVATHIDALVAAVAGRASVSVHVRRGLDHGLPRTFSPLWVIVKELDALIGRLMGISSETTGLMKMPHRRIQPLILLATDEPAIEARLAARYGRDRLIIHAKPHHGSPGAAATDRQSVAAIEDALIDLVLLSHGDAIVGSFESSFSTVAAAMGGKLHVAAARPRSDVISLGVSKMVWGLKPMAEKADALEEEAERKDPKRWVAGRIAAAMAKEGAVAQVDVALGKSWKEQLVLGKR